MGPDESVDVDLEQEVLMKMRQKMGKNVRPTPDMSAAAALASLAARSSAATPSSPVGPRRLSAAVLNNVIGPGSSRRTAGAASSPIFSSTC